MGEETVVIQQRLRGCVSNGLSAREVSWFSIKIRLCCLVCTEDVPAFLFASRSGVRCSLSYPAISSIDTKTLPQMSVFCLSLDFPPPIRKPP